MPNVAETIEQYNSIRHAAYQLVQDWPQIYLGDDQWLVVCIGEFDFSLDITDEVVDGYGSVWSNRTQDYEQFTFRIPVHDIEHWLGEAENAEAA